jgi:YggT family protein
MAEASLVDILVSFVELFVMVFNFLLIVRVILSYIVPPDNRLFAGVASLTEPLLAPVRRILPPAVAGVDWAPLIVFFGLQGVVYLMHALIGV